MPESQPQPPYGQQMAQPVIPQNPAQPAAGHPAGAPEAAIVGHHATG